MAGGDPRPKSRTSPSRTKIRSGFQPDLRISGRGEVVRGGPSGWSPAFPVQQAGFGPAGRRRSRTLVTRRAPLARPLFQPGGRSSPVAGIAPGWPFAADDHDGVDRAGVVPAPSAAHLHAGGAGGSCSRVRGQGPRARRCPVGKRSRRSRTPRSGPAASKQLEVGIDHEADAAGSWLETWERMSFSAKTVGLKGWRRQNEERKP